MKRKSLRPIHTKLLSIPCTQEEFDTIKGLWRRTTSRKFAEYARKVLQRVPVVTTYRNLSIDQLIDTTNELREELRKLMELTKLTDRDKERMAGIIQEIKTIYYQIADQCIPK